MIEFLLSVLSSIIGNLLTPSVKKGIGLKDEPVQLPPAPVSNADDFALEQHRQYVRQQWEIYSWTAFVFFVLIFFVGVALALPVAIKTSFFNEPLACTNLRFADWCSGGSWAANALKPLLVFLGAGCAMIVWTLAQLLADPVAAYVHRNHRHVGPILYRRILALTIMLLAFLLCGQWIYVLYPKFGYWEAVGLPFLIIGMVGFMSGRR